MDPESRESMILDGALQFFAEHGFAAQTRDLADELGVSHALIFHYFRSKSALVEQVYQKNFLTGWRDEWVRGLKDRSMPLRDRLERFYLSYLERVDRPEWIRIALYSGLAGNDLTRRYIKGQVSLIMKVIAEEIHVCCGEGTQPMDETRALERVWHLHSSFIYYLIRKHLFGTDAVESHGDLIDIVVDTFLYGIEPRTD